jgi:DNA-binding MurR/RpiR family transcriptional regulator
VTNNHARSLNASSIATDMSRLANISPTTTTRTASRLGSSQFAPHAVMYQA